MVWIWLILLSVVSAMLYRMGGAGPADLQKEWGWVPGFIRNFPKKRDLGCGLITVVGCLVIGLKAPWWAYFLSVGLMWASLSTYWDELFGYDNHWFHGLVIGFSMLPVAFFGEPLALGIRCIALAILMGVWSKINGDAYKEELGRGFVMPITLGLLLIL